jgi:hypothetical protein
MKNKKNDDSWRVLYLRLLREVDDRDDNSPELTQDELKYLKELCDEDFIYGKIEASHDGELFGWADGLTLKGMLFAEEQQKFIYDRSLWGRIKNGAGVSVGWLAGVLSSVVVYYLTKDG